MSINLVWRTDVHLSDRAPSSRTDDWADAVFDKLGQVRDLAREVNAAAIIDGGDFFHIKSPGRNSHALVHRTAEHHSTYPCPVYCTPGNHDSVYGDYSFLPQQPLGVLYSTGIFKRLYDEHEAVFIVPSDRHPEHLSESMGFKVRVVGVPYHGNRYDMERFTSIEKGDEDILICVAHVLASNKGGTMFEGEDIIKYADLVDTAPDVFLFGHWHKNQGVEEIGGKQFVNIGSLTRGSLSQDNLDRVPAAAVLRCTEKGVEVEVKPLNVRPAVEVFDVEGRERQVKRQVEMDSFVTAIRDALQPAKEGETLAEAVTSMGDVPNEIRERALAYLESA
jgi:DNA repair exonuclease SbcCD nuclease subunit